VGIAVQSYNGKMCFGLTADAVVVADVRRLRDFIGASWEELCRAAGVRPAPQSAARRRKPVAKHKAAKPQPVSAVVEPAPVEPSAAKRKAAKPQAVNAVVEPAPVEPPAAKRKAAKPQPASAAVEPAPVEPPAEKRKAAKPQPVSAAVEPAPVEPPAAAEFAPPVEHAKIA
jgi:hypothetical protein